MDFLKKHIGLLISTVVCLVLMLVLILTIRGKSKNVEQGNVKVKEQQDLLAQISTRGGYALSKKNVDIARQNREQVAGEINRLLLELYRKSRIERQNISALEAIRYVKDQVRDMKETLEEKDIVAGAAADNFSFSAVVATRTLPPASDVPRILRQVSIVKEIVTWAAASYLTEFKSVSRPLGLEVKTRDTYSLTPLSMTVVGGLPQIQEFVNSLQTKSQYLFVVRSISFSSVQKGASGEADGRGGRGEAARGALPPPGLAPSGTVAVKPRQERLVFKPGQLSVDLAVDLLEFKNPNAEAEE